MAVAPFFGSLSFFRLFPLSFLIAVLGVVLTMVGLLAAGASDKRRQAENFEKKRLWDQQVNDLSADLVESKRSHEESQRHHLEREIYWENYLFDSLKTSVEDLNWITADLVRSSGVCSETELTASRKIILEMMRHYLGPATGVRTNVFELDSHNEMMIANPNLTFGRQDRCSLRSFAPIDTTYKMAKQGLTRVEPDIRLLAEENKGDLVYETFMSAPIATGEKLFGIVTIDAPKAGDLTELDRALFIHLAQLFSLTYALSREERGVLEIKPQVYLHDNKEEKDA